MQMLRFRLAKKLVWARTAQTRMKVLWRVLAAVSCPKSYRDAPELCRLRRIFSGAPEEATPSPIPDALAAATASRTPGNALCAGEHPSARA